MSQARAVCFQRVGILSESGTQEPVESTVCSFARLHRNSVLAPCQRTEYCAHCPIPERYPLCKDEYLPGVGSDLTVRRDAFGLNPFLHNDCRLGLDTTVIPVPYLLLHLQKRPHCENIGNGLQ